MAPNPAYLGYRAASAVARALPAPLIRPATHVVATVGSRVMPGRRRMVERHQLRVRPALSPDELRRAVHAAFASYVTYWIESFRLPGTSPEVLDHGFAEDGFRHVREAIDAGTGCILAVPHVGGWEWAAFWLTAFQGMPVTAVAEDLEPPELAAWFVGLREALGMEVVPLGPGAGGAAAAALDRNRVLALVCDRAIGEGGVEVEFFGERTLLPAGPATLALRTGAPLVPAAVYFDGDRHLGVARAPLDSSRKGRLREDVARLTQELAWVLEDLIREAPEQWHLLQPNWPSDRTGASPGSP